MKCPPSVFPHPLTKIPLACGEGQSMSRRHTAPRMVQSSHSAAALAQPQCLLFSNNREKHPHCGGGSVCGCLCPAQKRGRGGVGSEASIAPQSHCLGSCRLLPLAKASCMGDGSNCGTPLPAPFFLTASPWGGEPARSIQ